MFGSGERGGDGTSFPCFLCTSVYSLNKVFNCYQTKVRAFVPIHIWLVSDSSSYCVFLKKRKNKGNRALVCVLASIAIISWATFLNRHVITYVSLSSLHPKYQEEETEILAIPPVCPNFGRNSRREAVCTLKSDGRMTSLFIKANHFPALSLANPLSVIIKSVHTT